MPPPPPSAPDGPCSGPDTKAGKLAVPTSTKWGLLVYPTLPHLWDQWYATYVPRLAAPSAADIMANPLGESKVAQKELKGEDMLKEGIEGLPEKDYFVAIIGTVEVVKGGSYLFCSPKVDG